MELLCVRHTPKHLCHPVPSSSLFTHHSGRRCIAEWQTVVREPHAFQQLVCLGRGSSTQPLFYGWIEGKKSALRGRTVRRTPAHSPPLFARPDLWELRYEALTHCTPPQSITCFILRHTLSGQNKNALCLARLRNADFGAYHVLKVESPNYVIW
jgi:hypothetical protein